jgi:protein-tyrosine phosphatase
VLRTSTVRGFVDLHCHWVAAVDDGARTVDESLAMLRGLHQAGFDAVVATPHMRPGMFDNDRASIERAFAAMKPVLSAAGALPSVHLGSEHFFDDIVYGRILRGEAVPYPRLAGETVNGAGDAVAAGAGGAGGTGERDRSASRRPVLIEFGPAAFPVRLQHRLFDLRRAGLVPVLAHPERYEPVWKDDACLDPLLDAGAHLLLDVCALVGKYGRAPQRAAEKLLEEDAYEAACSDAHRPSDVEIVVQSIERLEALVGAVEARRLLADGPRAILGG